MEKLLELEKKLREYREELEKAMKVAPEGSKNRESYKKEFKKKEKKHEDEKEDKKMIAEALDLHNEKKHDEAKDEDSALKDAGLKKGLGSDLEANESKERVKHAIGSIRQSAKVTDSEGNISEISPAKQISDKASAEAQKKANNKAKAESEAAARRAAYKKNGLMKNNEQWKLE